MKTFMVQQLLCIQIESTSFSLTFYGNGYSEKLNDTEAQHDTPPDLKIVTRVVGPGKLIFMLSTLHFGNPEMLFLLSYVRMCAFVRICMHYI